MHRSHYPCNGGLQVSDRLAALDEATQQLHAVAEGKPGSVKLSRAMAKLDKTESLAWMDTPALPCAASQAVRATPEAAAATQASPACASHSSCTPCLLCCWMSTSAAGNGCKHAHAGLTPSLAQSTIVFSLAGMHASRLSLHKRLT